MGVKEITPQVSGRGGNERKSPIEKEGFEPWQEVV